MSYKQLTWPDIFDRELSMIKDESLKASVLNILERHVSRRLTIEPASSTGKYHPDFARGEGGTIRHTKAVVFILLTLLQTRPDIDDSLKDKLIAAAILHDMCKYDDINRHTLFVHPNLMCNVCYNHSMQEVGDIVATHMGQWTTTRQSSVVLDYPSTENQWLLHYADYLASRTWFRLDFVDGEIVEEYSRV